MSPRPAHPVGGRAFTLAEAAVSMVLVGVLMVASLRALGAARLAQHKTGETLRAQLLADDLLAEILGLPYGDPSGSSVLGLEADEFATSRAGFDDVDDYNGWIERPVQNRDGTPMGGYSNWARTVSVVGCTPTAPMTDSATDTGIKRITVKVIHNNVEVASAVAIKGNYP